MEQPDDALQDLIGQSSLGALGARQLRDRISQDEVNEVLRLVTEEPAPTTTASLSHRATPVRGERSMAAPAGSLAAAERGALVRPYAVTRGRTEPRRDIPIEAVLVGSQAGVQEARFAGHDKYRIAVLCEAKAESLAELSALTRLPLGVARVLVADMVADGLLSLHSAAPKTGFSERMDLLERVLSGLRKL